MAISKFLDPKNDFAFKRIFGTERNQDILIDFINAVVGFEGKDRVVTVSFIKTTQDPEIASNEKDITRIAGLDVAIARAYEELDRFSWTQTELNTYEQEEKRERDAQAILEAKLEDAEAKGEAKGMQLKQLAIAKKLLTQGMTDDFIAEATDLSLEEIQKLKEVTTNL